MKFGLKRDKTVRSAEPYAVAGPDSVEELPHLPQSATGAPLPHVIAGMNELFLIYLNEDGTEGGHLEETVGTIQVIEPYAHYFGPPNDCTPSNPGRRAVTERRG